MSTTELAIQEDSRLVSLDSFRARLEEKRELIRSQVAPGCPDAELDFFIEQCARLQLDPIVKQAYFIKRRSGDGFRWTFQVGIDGFRSVADRTDAYAGSDDAEFEYRGDAKPTLARVTVWKLVQGQRCAFTASARWDEYFPGERQAGQWLKMPHVMLAKVAEALALRKGFPAQLGGVYIHEEMHQADSPPIIDVKAKALPVIVPSEDGGEIVKQVQDTCTKAMTQEEIDGARDYLKGRWRALNPDQQKAAQDAIKAAEARLHALETRRQLEADA